MPSDDQNTAPDAGSDDAPGTHTPPPDAAADSANGATLPDAATNGAGVEEDDPTLLDPAVRSLEPDAEIVAEPAPPPAERDRLGGGRRVNDELWSPQEPPRSEPSPGVVADASVGAPAEVGGDADAIVEDVADREALLDTQRPEFTPHERVAHRTAVELKRIEMEVRELLEQFDTRRKRKLSGTRRWRELEDDIVRWRFGGRFDEEALGRLQRLVARRHDLFHRLRFFADTRVRWNS